MELHHLSFVYFSKLAPDANPSCVADIVKTARGFNRQHSITGILVFDGERFCQYIEGPAQPLQGLIDRIAKDVRHTDFQPKLHAPLEGARRFESWSMGYVLLDDLSEATPLDVLQERTGAQMIEHLQSLVPMLDAV